VGPEDCYTACIQIRILELPRIGRFLKIAQYKRARQWFIIKYPNEIGLTIIV